MINSINTTNAGQENLRIIINQRLNRHVIVRMLDSHNVTITIEGKGRQVYKTLEETLPTFLDLYPTDVQTIMKPIGKSYLIVMIQDK